jgi:hypothetical protein
MIHPVDRFFAVGSRPTEAGHTEDSDKHHKLFHAFLLFPSMRTVPSFDCDSQGGFQIRAIAWRGLSNSAQNGDGS